MYCFDKLVNCLFPYRQYTFADDFKCNFLFYYTEMPAIL